MSINKGALYQGPLQKKSPKYEKKENHKEKTLTKKPTENSRKF